MGNFFRPKNYYILESSEQLMLLEAADFPISSVEKARASFADWFIVYTLSYEQSYRLKSRLFTAEGELLHEAQTADVFWFDLEQELRKLLHEQLQVVLVQPKPSTSSPPKVVQKMFLLRQEEDLRRSWYHLQDEASSFELVDKAQAWFQKAQETQSQLKEDNIIGEMQILTYVEDWLHNKKKPIPPIPKQCNSMKSYAKSLGKQAPLHWDGKMLSFSHGSVEMLWEVAQTCIPQWDCPKKQTCQTNTHLVRFFYDNGPRMQFIEQ